MALLWSELGLAFRQIRHSPAVPVGIALAVGLGVGANLAVHTLLLDAFLPPGPYFGRDRLVIVENTGPYFYEGNVPQGRNNPLLSGPDFDDVASQQRSFAALGAFDDTQSAVVVGGDRPRLTCRIYVTAGMLDVLSVPAIAGRLLDAADFRPGAPPVALITDSVWRGHFGAYPAAVGRSVTFDEQPYSLVGVLPDAAFGLLQRRTDLLADAARDRCAVTPFPAATGAPASGRAFEYFRQHRDVPWLRVVGRLRPGIDRRTAQAELAVISADLAQAHPSTNQARRLWASSLEAWRTSDVRALLITLAAAAALALLVACANAAGLAMSESVRREPELAVRFVLGATPSHLVWLFIVRALVWCSPGALVGYLCGRGMLISLRSVTAGGGVEAHPPELGLTAVAATVILTIVAGAATGAVASWGLRRRTWLESLQEGSHTVSMGRRRHRLGRVLVGVQVATATTLAVGAALLVQSVWSILRLDRGFDMGRGVVVQFRLPASAYRSATDYAQFYQRTLSTVRALPDVVATGISSSPPLTGTSTMLSGTLAVETSSATRELRTLDAQFVSAGYLESLGVRLVRGRLFSEADERSRALVVVVDETFCRRQLDGADPLASTLRLGSEPLAIIGVIRDVRQSSGAANALAPPSELPGGTAYVPLTRIRRTPRWSFLVVRSKSGGSEMGEAAVRALMAADRAAIVEEPRSFTELLAAAMADRRRLLVLLLTFAGVALTLTGVSLFGALTQFAAVRRRETAIRLALGATRRDVIALLWRHLAPALIIGIAAGTAGGLLVGRLLASQLEGLQPGDGSMLASVVGLVLVVTAVAAASPVWRACRVDPATALRAA